ncbi:MAG: hypothetical protein AAGK32_00705 [Actinomycetota bacterium]
MNSPSPDSAADPPRHRRHSSPDAPSHPSAASRRDPDRTVGGVGPSSKEDWEQVRRSVAMLPPGAWAMTREEALRALRSLVRCLER